MNVTSHCYSHWYFQWHSYEIAILERPCKFISCTYKKKKSTECLVSLTGSSCNVECFCWFLDEGWFTVDIPDPVSLQPACWQSAVFIVVIYPQDKSCNRQLNWASSHSISPNYVSISIMFIARFTVRPVRCIPSNIFHIFSWTTSRQSTFIFNTGLTIIIYFSPNISQRTLKSHLHILHNVQHQCSNDFWIGRIQWIVSSPLRKYPTEFPPVSHAVCINNPADKHNKHTLLKCTLRWIKFVGSPVP